MILKNKFQEGGKIMAPKGDPYEYKQVGNDYYTRLKEGNRSWIKTKGQMKSTIASMVYNIMDEPIIKDTKKAINNAVNRFVPEGDENSAVVKNVEALVDDGVDMIDAISSGVSGFVADTFDKVKEKVTDILGEVPEDPTKPAKPAETLDGGYTPTLIKNRIKESEYKEFDDLYKDVVPEVSKFVEDPLDYIQASITGVVPASAKGIYRFLKDSYSKGKDKNIDNMYKVMEMLTVDDYSIKDRTELARAVKFNLSKGRGGTLHYTDYHYNNPGIRDGSRGNQSKDSLISKVTDVAVNSKTDLKNSIGGASTFINDLGEVIVADMYNFNAPVSQGAPASFGWEEMKKTYETKIKPGWKVRKAQYDEGSRSFGELLSGVGNDMTRLLGNSGLTYINLGKASHFLTPEEAANLPKFEGKDKFIESVLKREAPEFYKGWKALKDAKKKLEELTAKDAPKPEPRPEVKVPGRGIIPTRVDTPRSAHTSILYRKPRG